MKLSELDRFIEKNNLLTKVENTSGIYAITIDEHIVYVGQSNNMCTRCRQHIYNTENAILSQEKKYLLLLSAELGGHRVDCHTLECCPEDKLLEVEEYYITKLNPILNILVNHKRKDISGLKIEDVLAAAK